MGRYMDQVSDLGVYRVLKRNGMSRLPTNAGRGGYSHRGQIVFEISTRMGIMSP